MYSNEAFFFFPILKSNPPRPEYSSPQNPPTPQQDSLLASESSTPPIRAAEAHLPAQLSLGFNEQLKCKFVAANLLGTEGIANKKFKAVLDAFEIGGAQVGTTHRNVPSTPS